MPPVTDPRPAQRRPVVPCVEIDDPDRKTHAWEATGLDTESGSLANTRRCVWCGTTQFKPYGAGGGRGWKTRRG